MIDRLFTAALAFVILAGGTAAIGSALFAPEHPAQATVQRPAVEVTAQRVAQSPATTAVR